MNRAPHDSDQESGKDRLGVRGAAEFEELIHPLYPRIYRWALVITGSHDDADDVTQNTMIRAYRHFSSLENRAAISSWLYRITRNVAIEMMGKAGRRGEKTDRDVARKVVDSGAEERMATTIDMDRLLGIVRTFFEELSERQREVFDLVDLQGYEPAEAATMLEIDAATARTHLMRARRAVRKRILMLHPELVEELGR